MKKLIYGVAVAVLAMVSCAKEIQDPTVQEFGSTGTHSLSVGIEAGAYQAEDETKASMNPVVRVAWRDGDKVSVVNATTQTVLGGHLEADPQDANGYIATFSGTVTGTINVGDVLYYIYPVLENAPSTEGGFGEYAISLQNQKYDTNNPYDVCFYGYAQDIAGANPGSISKKIQFNLVTAYVHLNMSNLPAAGTSLTSLDLSNVNGGFKWAMDNKVLSAKPYLENQGISVACTNTNISKSGNAIVRFAVPESPEINDPNIARVLTVNKAYTNSGYSKAKRNAAAYYNQLYSSWQSNNVKVEDKGTEVEVKIDNGGSTESAEGILPVAETFKSDKPASISMGGVGTITFDKTATEKILDNAEDAGSTNVFFKVEDVTKTKPVQNANIVYEVTMKTVDEKGVEVFSTDKAAGVATVVVPLDDNVESVQSVSLVKDDGTPIEGGVVEESVKFEKPNLTFQVNHFSKYAIKYTLSETQIDPVALIGERKYATLESAVAAVQHGQTITLIKDVELENPIVTDKTFTLTLNANISPVSTWEGGGYKDGIIIINRGGDLTINGTGKILNGGVEKVYAAVKMTQKDEPDGVAAKLTVDGNVTLEGYYYGIVGGGTRHNTEITINGGTINGCNATDCQGIYHPQDGKLTINGGTISGYNSAIELRGGTLEINGGTLTCTASPLEVDPNGSGSTTKGAALAIAQHTTKKDINVTINGGTLEGYKAIAIKDVQNNGTENVTVTYKAGTLNGGITLGHGTFNLTGNLAVIEPVMVIGKTTLDLGNATLEAKFANTDNNIYAPVIVSRGGDLTIEGNNGMINSGEAYGGVQMINPKDTGDAKAKLTVKSGTIEGHYFGIVGNGSRHNTEIIVKGGTIKSSAEKEGLGIYHPQNGTLTITGGEITGYESAVELRGGTINVSGGTLTSTATEFKCNPNGSGSTTVGAALAIAQHTTKVDLGVTITGGTFIGVKALNESNPQANDPAPQVTMSVSDGKFKGEVSTVDVKNFISGGLFSTKPEADLIVEGKAAVENTDPATSGQYPWTIGERPNVAKIGDTEYATLKEAFDAVPENATEATTITIINNANETFESRGAELKNGKKVILDLNGYKLVGTSTKPGYTQYFYIENGCELTVKSSQTGGAIEYHDGYIENLTSGSSTGGSAITCHGCMTLESGTIENKTPDTNTNDLEGAIDMYTNAWGKPYNPADIVLNIKGGVVKSNNANTVRLTSFSAQSYTTSVTVNMNGGEVYGRDGFFIQGVSESYLNTNTLNLNGGKVYGTQAVRVMASQSHANTSESKPVTIKIGEGVELTNNYFAQSTKTGWSEDICIDNLQGSFEQLLSYVNIIVEGGGSLCCENRFNVI